MGLLDAAARNTEGERLTPDLLKRTAEKIRSQPPPPPHRHLLNPKALHTPGTYTCVECGQPVEVTIPLSEL